MKKAFLSVLVAMGLLLASLPLVLGTPAFAAGGGVATYWTPERMRQAIANSKDAVAVPHSRGPATPTLVNATSHVSPAAGASHCRPRRPSSVRPK